MSISRTSVQDQFWTPLQGKKIRSATWTSNHDPTWTSIGSSTFERRLGNFFGRQVDV